jgi:hypothetical protein
LGKSGLDRHNPGISPEMCPLEQIVDASSCNVNGERRAT